MNDEIIYDVFWEGPYNYDNRQKLMEDHHVLYQIYGHHPVYGSEVLLYIGMTQKGEQRLCEHDWWIQYECDAMTVRYGSVGKFTTWDEWYKSEQPYKKAQSAIVEAIESLLIYAHQPAYNSQNKATAKEAAKGIHIFNSGKFGQLLPEVSYRYYLGA